MAVDKSQAQSVAVTNPTVAFRSSLTAQKDHLFHERERNQNWAFTLKISSTILAAGITIALGLREGTPQDRDTLANVALILGALIGVISATDAFYNPRALWIRNATILHHLLKIQDELDYQSAVHGDNIPPDDLGKLHEKYQDILSEMDQSWLEISGRASSTQSAEK